MSRYNPLAELDFDKEGRPVFANRKITDKTYKRLYRPETDGAGGGCFA